MVIISSLGKFGVDDLQEEEIDVHRFRRSLQPKGKRKKLLFQVYATEAGERPHRAFGARQRTVAADDIADVQPL